MNNHTYFMAMALQLGARGLGQVAPNPAVGCVIVKDGAVVGRGFTAKGGRPHAETQALEQAGDAAQGATAYISLEPCSHQGKTPPCAQALIKAGIAKVVCPMEDPDPRVSGKGFAMLKAAGVEVKIGVMEKEAQDVHEGFLKRIKFGRPMFTLKIATTLDGRIATAKGESRWITGEAARAYVHALRVQHDAVMVGIGTALTDNPMLDCRLPGRSDASPIRLVVDRQLLLSPESVLAQTARATPTWLITQEKFDKTKAAVLEKLGITLIPVPLDGEGYTNLSIAARKLGELGLTRILVEGGAHLAAALLREDVIDRVEWFTAPFVLGDTGRPALKDMGLATLKDAQRFKAIATRAYDEDTLQTLVRVG